MQFSIVAIHSSKFGSVNHYPGYQRFFSRAAGIFGVAEGQHIFSHYKDLTETRNRARKVSGTQGSKSLSQRKKKLMTWAQHDKTLQKLSHSLTKENRL